MICARTAALSAAFLLAGAAPASALTTQSLSQGLTAADLAASLAGPGVAVSNVTFTGAPVAGGRFGDGQAAIGFDSGILLSSGDVAGVVGPNVEDGKSTTNGTPGDAALTQLSGFETSDAAILEFDFVPQAGQVEFKYVFSSDEYNEFANGSVNDVFAFFVNGTNCALVPGTSQPVSVNTVNGGNPYGQGAVNPQYFRNNDPNDPPGSTPSIPTEMDGLTTVFTCTAAVTPNAANRMRLGIADAGDSSLDSNVFLQAGSLVSGGAPACSDGADNDGDGAVDFPADPSCTDANDGTEGAATLATLPPPVIGETANVEPVKGSVFVALPAAAAAGRARAAQKGLTFIPLSEARSVPVGSFLDTDEGTVRIQSATKDGGLQAGDFFGGLFQLLQQREGTEKGLTEVSLKGSSFRGCRARRSDLASASRRRLSRRVVRKLNSNADGAFRSRGRNSSATVRGTVWVTSDRCDGTLTRVKRGKVAVRDFRRRRTVIVRAGKSYLAKAQR